MANTVVGDFCDVDQTVDPAEVDESSEIGYRPHPALDLSSRFERRPGFISKPSLLLSEMRRPRHHQALAVGLVLEDLEDVSLSEVLIDVIGAHV
jgi:hypothetical protein